MANETNGTTSTLEPKAPSSGVPQKIAFTSLADILIDRHATDKPQKPQAETPKTEDKWDNVTDESIKAREEQIKASSERAVTPEVVKSTETKTQSLMDMMSEPSKPEVKAEPEVSRDSKKTDKANETMAAMRVAKATAEKELASLRAEYEKVKGTPQVNPDFERLKSERDELSKIVEIISAEQHPAFRAKYEKETLGVLGRVDSIATQAGVSPEDIKNVLKMSPSKDKADKLDEIMSGMSEYHKGQLHIQIDKLESISSERQHELANPRATLDQYRQKQEEDHRERLAQQEQTFMATHKKMSEYLAPIRYIEGNEELSQMAAAKVDYARKLYTGDHNISQEDIATACLAAVSAADFKRGFEQRGEEIVKLKEKLKSLQASNPTIEGHSSESSPSKDKGKSYVDLVADMRPKR